MCNNEKTKYEFYRKENEMPDTIEKILKKHYEGMFVDHRNYADAVDDIKALMLECVGDNRSADEVEIYALGTLENVRGYNQRGQEIRERITKL